MPWLSLLGWENVCRRRLNGRLRQGQIKAIDSPGETIGKMGSAILKPAKLPIPRLLAIIRMGSTKWVLPICWGIHWNGHQRNVTRQTVLEMILITTSQRAVAGYPKRLSSLFHDLDFQPISHQIPSDFVVSLTELWRQKRLEGVKISI